MVPGWHTTIYPAQITWAIVTVILLSTSMLIYLMFRMAGRWLAILLGKLK